MVEARFDDLTGAQPSFRLVGPVGVVEASRSDEVRGVLEAAEAAAARGRWVAGFLAYEAAPGLDPSLPVRPPAPGDPMASLPLAWFAMFDGRQETTLPDPREDAPPADDAAWVPSVDRATYDAAIDTIHARIAAGDTYQVNHTLRLRATLDGDPRGLYRDLCHAQRGAYAGYLDLGRYRILSASPELFLAIEGDRIWTKPMKGTAPRGRWLAEDDVIRERLRGSVKDRAENAMIVDLLRNDLGRVARPGTVTWSDVFEAERFETVWQLTSTVEARLDPSATLVDAMGALFPCGSVTGAPKVETMGIIAGLEDSPRGVYCGTVGYLAPPGAPGPRARFNVAIRTVVQDAGSGLAVYGAGGGITWDSRASSEYGEVLAKARLLTVRRPSFRLVETLVTDPGVGARSLERHLDRLRDSATYFGFAFDEARIHGAIDAEVDRAEGRAIRLRVVLDRRGRVDTAAVPLAASADTVAVEIDTAVPVDPSDALLFHKTTARDRYDDARARHPDAEDVILTNTRGEVTESTIANVAALIDGVWVTPPLDAGLLPGIGRAVAIDEGRLREAPIALEGLLGAEEVALVSDNRGWRRATVLGAVSRAGAPSGPPAPPRSGT